jgi:hypothetical protein
LKSRPRLPSPICHPFENVCITIREIFVFLRNLFGSSRALFFHKETRKPGNQEFSNRFLDSWFLYGFSVAAAPRWVFHGSKSASALISGSKTAPS